MIKSKLAFLLIAAFAPLAQAEETIDIPTRPGVTQRFIYGAPANAKAVVILFAGGDGGVQLKLGGGMKALGKNFLVRSRSVFAEKGFAFVVVDAPSDRQSPPYLNGFRQTAEHVADIRAVIAWLREKNKIPVWLIGTSRGTQSAAYIATQLARGDGGPDGVVLTSSIVVDPKGHPIPDMALQRIAVPVLVVHHEQDGCRACPPPEVHRIVDGLSAAPRKELIWISGGITEGDPCEAFAHHGYNGIEGEVVAKIAAWIEK